MIDKSFSISETHGFCKRQDHVLRASSEALGWRSLLVLDQHEGRFSVKCPSVRDHMLVFQRRSAARLTCRLGDLRGSKIVYPGQVSLVPADADIELETDRDLDSVHLYLRAAIVSETFEGLGNGETCFLNPQFGVMDPILSGLIQGCLAALDQQYAMSSAYIDHFAWAISAHLVGTYSNRRIASRVSEDGTLPPDRFQRVDDYIRVHIAHDIGVADLAKAAGYNMSYFGRLFRQTVGSTPYRYLQKKRVEAAASALQTSATLAEVAIATGYCNQEHMTRSFRQFYGTTPGKLRRSMSTPVHCLKR